MGVREGGGSPACRLDQLTAAGGAAADSQLTAAGRSADSQLMAGGGAADKKSNTHRATTHNVPHKEGRPSYNVT